MDITTPVPATATPSAVQEKTSKPWETAKEIKGVARAVLGGHSGVLSHRLTLTLGVILLITVAIALYAAVACLALAGEFALGDALWIDAVANCLLVMLELGLAYPLVVSLGRLSCLMAAPDGEITHGMAVSVPTPDLTEIFYPFTSLRAYGRTMAVGMEALAFLLCGIGLPVLLGRLAWLSMLTAGWETWLRVLTMTGIVILSLGWAGVVLLLSGRRMGFGYFVFAHEELSLGDANRYYRTLDRPLLPALCLRLHLLGLYALSVVAICVPFVFHSIPFGFCCKAVCGRDLKRR